MSNEINFRSTIVFEKTYEAVLSKKYKLIEEVGGSRSSKTWSNFQIIFLDLYTNPLTSATILRETQKSCREIVETDWINWLSDPMGRKKELSDGLISPTEFYKLISNESLLKYFTRNKTNHTWTFNHNQSFMRFTGLDDPDDAMGMTQDICWVNEPYNFGHEVYRQLSQRTSKYILFDWNPKQNHWIEIERQKENSITLRSTLLDNPFCPKESRVQILSYQPVSHCEIVLEGLIKEEDVYNYDFESNHLNFTKKQVSEAKRCLYNESTKSSSLYHWLVYGLGEKAEKPNRIFSWKNYTLHDYNALNVPIYYGTDWGKVDPWGIVEAKYHDGRLFLKELNYLSENEHRAKLNETERLTVGSNEDDEGIVTWLFGKIGIDKNRPILCDSNRPTKIAALRRKGYEYALPAKTKETGNRDILDGIDLLDDLDVYIVGDSPNLQYEHENYSRKVDRYGVILDEPEDLNNHLIDPSRYVAQYLRKIGVITKV